MASRRVPRRAPVVIELLWHSLAAPFRVLAAMAQRWLEICKQRAHSGIPLIPPASCVSRDFAARQAKA